MHSNVPLTPVTFLERSAKAFPKRSALVCAGEVISFSSLLRRTRCLAQALTRLQVAPGDRVAVLAENSIQTVEAHFAIPGAGAVLVMLNPWLSQVDIVDLLNFSEPKVLIADADLYYRFSIEQRKRLKQELRILIVHRVGDSLDAETLDYETTLAKEDGSVSLEHCVDSEFDPIAINFTSGTTGRPKGVIYSHRAGYLHALGQVLMVGLTKHSKYLWTLPMFHVNGWGHMWACVAAGCSQIIPTANFSHDRASEFLSMVQAHGITHLAGAPRLIRMLSDVPDPQRTLQDVTIVTGGSAPSPVLIQRLEGMGVNLIHQYGLNETCGPFVVCEAHAEWDSLSSEARAQLRARQGTAAIHAGTGLQVMGTDGKAVPQDGRTLGEVVMAGNTLALGYYKNPEATDKAFRKGWFYSGDMAVVHPDGSLEIRDRIKDLIYVETEYGWENISSIEVENIMCRHFAIQDAAVVSVLDGRHADNRPLLVAFVELQSEERLSEEAFHAYCVAELSEYKRPQAVFFGKLPKTNTGKIRKDILNAEAVTRLGAVPIQSRMESV